MPPPTSRLRCWATSVKCSTHSQGSRTLRIVDASRIPALPGARPAGHWPCQQSRPCQPPRLVTADPPAAGQPAPSASTLVNTHGSKSDWALLELLVDPQTCGPLLISVTPTFAAALLDQPGHSWHAIGRVSPAGDELSSSDSGAPVSTTPTG